jgi:hypothetical protein
LVGAAEPEDGGRGADLLPFALDMASQLCVLCAHARRAVPCLEGLEGKQRGSSVDELCERRFGETPSV